MKSVLIIIVCCVAAVPGTSAQLGVICPNIGNDLATCAVTLPPSIHALFPNTEAVLEPSTLVTDTLPTICSNRDIVKSFFLCMAGKLTQCAPAEWHKAEATSEQVQYSIDYLCQQEDNVDIPCLASGSVAMTTCKAQGLQGQIFDVTTAEGVLQYNCRVSLINKDCLTKTFSSCSKALTPIVLREYIERRKPIACRARNTLSSSLLTLTLLVLVYQYGY